MERRAQTFAGIYIPYLFIQILFNRVISSISSLDFTNLMALIINVTYFRNYEKTIRYGTTKYLLARLIFVNCQWSLRLHETAGFE